MRYFPFTKDRFEHQFGIRALPSGESIIEATEDYHDQISLRREALQRNHDYYFQATSDSVSAQREARDLIIESTSFLRGGFNRKMGEPVDLKGDQPLAEISRHIQEDLAIMAGDRDQGFPMIAGAILFPSGWCVGDKLGKSLLDTHTEVPQFDSELNPPTQQLFARLKPGRPVWRTNWGVRPSDQLDQSPIHAEYLRAQRKLISSENAGRDCFFRVERQTLSRLPGGDLLFTIHTHQTPLRRLPRQQRATLMNVIQTCPVETLQYKGIWPMKTAIVQYLQKSIA